MITRTSILIVKYIRILLQVSHIHFGTNPVFVFLPFCTISVVRIKLYLNLPLWLSTFLFLLQWVKILSNTMCSWIYQSRILSYILAIIFFSLSKKIWDWVSLFYFSFNHTVWNPKGCYSLKCFQYVFCKDKILIFVKVKKIRIFCTTTCILIAK